MYCKDLLNLSVLSLYEGELLGKVDKLFFDKKLKKLLEIEIIGQEGIRLSLPSKNIYNVGKNAITIKNNQMVTTKMFESNLVAVPIESKAYSINGEFFGVIKDVCLNEKFFTEKILLENDQAVNINHLLSCGKNTVIFNASEEKINIKNLVPSVSPQMVKSKVEQEVHVMPTENKNVVAIEVKPTSVQNADFLIGRTCSKNIFNFNNELLIKEQAVVTKKVLKEISKFGKLRELMLYIK